MNGSVPQRLPDGASGRSVAQNDAVPSGAPSLPAAFAHIAHTLPDKLALIDGNRRWTYRDIDRAAGIAAAQLEARGATRGDCIGIHMDRSAAAIVAMLAIHRLGATYVPFDPAAPAQRLAAQAAAGATRLLAVADAAMTPAWHAGEAVVVDPSTTTDVEPARARDVHPLDLAYVIYTSGSTNEPKGVCTTHRAVLDLVAGADYCGFLADDVVYHGMSIAFDGSTFEIWGALLTGATLVIAPPRLSVQEIADLAETHRVTVLLLSTGVFNALDAATLARLRSVRVLLAGGDVMSPAVARRFLAAGGRAVVNGYGPTEVTTFSHCHVMTAAAADDTPVPIGVPVPGTTAYVLDEHVRPLPLHAEGELYIAGSGLAQGYLGRPALTAERFVPDPIAADGSRMYRTGDLVSQAADGRLHYLGRIDTQVKIRGFRVELGEIETCLRSHAGVHDACVIPMKNADGVSALVAYVASRDAVDEAALLDALRARLPDYMIPRRVVFLAALPLTVNGKVDRKQLAAGTLAHDETTGAADPRDALEQSLLGTLERLLGQSRLAGGDNFFEVGGDSLTAMRFCAAINEQHGVSLPMAALFEEESLGQLVARVRFLKQSLSLPVESAR